jgi:hypothetical protein
MGVLVNIAKTDGKPIFIDASEVTNVLLLPERNEIGIYNSKGLLLHYTSKSENIDVNTITQKLIDGGASLIAFPTGYDANERQQFVSPAAVTYITHSKPAKDGTVAVVIGVKGSGQENTSGATQAETDAFLAAVSAKKDLIKFLPEVAYSRCTNPAALYIDAKSVTRITTNAHHNQVDVGFEESGGLDVQIITLNVNTIANEIYKRDGQTATDLKVVFDEAQRRKDIADKQAKFKFAHEIAIRHGGLISVPNPERAVYIQREDIGSISFHEEEDERDNKHILHIQPQTINGSYFPQAISLYFKTVADRMATFTLLNDVISAKPVSKNQNTPKMK